MAQNPPAGIATFDSATALLDGLAHALRGEGFPALGQSGLAVRLAPLANRLPLRLRHFAFAAGGPSEAVPARHADRVDAEQIAHWITARYPRRRYPAVMIGSSSGPLAHACAAMGIPWLPQTFLTLIRKSPQDPDDAKAAMEGGRRIAHVLLERNPGVSVHHMHDPNQDRRMTPVVSYFRLKHRALPRAYRDFLDECLEPGGTVYVVNCEQTWPLTTLSDRHFFQFGAVGGASRAEYFEGGENVRRYFHMLGKDRERWTPPEPDCTGAEAEWGYEPELDRDIDELVARRGLRLARLSFEDAEDLSPVVADLFADHYRAQGIEPRRLLIPSFILHDSYWTLRTASVPFWMVFNLASSQPKIRDYIRKSGPFDDIRMMLFSNGTPALGQGSIESWRSILAEARRTGGFLGVDDRAYPSDFATLRRYHTALKALQPHVPLPAPMELARFEASLRKSDALRFDAPEERAPGDTGRRLA